MERLVNFGTHCLCCEVTRLHVSFQVQQFVCHCPGVDLKLTISILLGSNFIYELTDFCSSKSHWEALSFSVLLGLLYNAETADITKSILGF